MKAQRLRVKRRMPPAYTALRTGSLVFVWVSDWGLVRAHFLVHRGLLLLCPHLEAGVKELPGDSSIRALTLLMGAPPS